MQNRYKEYLAKIAIMISIIPLLSLTFVDQLAYAGQTGQEQSNSADQDITLVDDQELEDFLNNNEVEGLQAGPESNYYKVITLDQVNNAKKISDAMYEKILKAYNAQEAVRLALVSRKINPYSDYQLKITTANAEYKSTYNDHREAYKAQVSTTASNTSSQFNDKELANASRSLERLQRELRIEKGFYDTYKNIPSMKSQADYRKAKIDKLNEEIAVAQTKYFNLKYKDTHIPITAVKPTPTPKPSSAPAPPPVPIPSVTPVVSPSATDTSSNNNGGASAGTTPASNTAQIIQNIQITVTYQDVKTLKEQADLAQTKMNRLINKATPEERKKLKEDAMNAKSLYEATNKLFKTQIISKIIEEYNQKVITDPSFADSKLGRIEIGRINKAIEDNTASQTNLASVKLKIAASNTESSGKNSGGNNQPSAEPTVQPSVNPTVKPTEQPIVEPTAQPTINPTMEPADNSSDQSSSNNDQSGGSNSDDSQSGGGTGSTGGSNNESSGNDQSEENTDSNNESSSNNNKSRENYGNKNSSSSEEPSKTSGKSYNFNKKSKASARSSVKIPNSLNSNSSATVKQTTPADNNLIENSQIGIKKATVTTTNSSTIPIVDATQPVSISLRNLMFSNNALSE